MNHEKFHGNRSALFSKIRNTDIQTDRASNFIYREKKKLRKALLLAYVKRFKTPIRYISVATNTSQQKNNFSLQTIEIILGLQNSLLLGFGNFLQRRLHAEMNITLDYELLL